MEHINDIIIDNLFGLIGVEKAWLKSIFLTNNLEWAWDFFRSYLFNPKIWLFAIIPAIILEKITPAFKNKKIITPHLYLDFLYPLFNLLITFSFVSIIIFSINDFYDEYVPWVNTAILDGQHFWVQAFGIFLITDFMFYVHHRLVHEARWLWYIHAIHHCQKELNPFTTNRFHPLQSVTATIVRAIPIGFIGGQESTWIAYILLNNFWGYFIHSNVKMNFSFLKKIIVTPQFHRIHHSIEERHFDKNYGERLVVWDWLFGSFYKGGLDEYPKTGVPDTEWITEKSFGTKEVILVWGRQMVYPFFMIYKSIVNWWPPTKT